MTEYVARVFVPAQTPPLGWTFIGAPIHTEGIAIQYVDYEALLQLRDIIPEMSEEPATRYLPSKSMINAM